MKPHLPLLAGLCIGLVALPPGSAAGLHARQVKPLERVMAGLVRPDGVIVPFAEYAGGRWLNAGADAGQPDGPTPRDWFTRGGQTPRDWTVLLGAGSRRNTQTNTATLVKSHCSMQWGLQSDIGDQPSDTPGRQVGVALSGPATLDGFETLDPASPDAARLSAAVAPTFEPDEDAAMARWAAGGNGRPRPAAERRALPLVVEAAYRSRISISGQALVYVRVSRTHRESAAASSACSRVSVLDAWIFVDDQGRLAVATANRFVMTDCARRDVRLGLPFGIVRVDSRAFVVSVDYYGEAEDYRISAVGGDAVRGVLSTYGGGCQG